MANVRVPGIGNVPKPALIGGIGVTAGILIFAYVKHRNTAAAAAPAASADTTGSTSDASGIDPNTGLPYADESAGGGYGYNPYAGGGNGYGYPQDCYYGVDPSTGQCLSQPTTAAGYTTNSEWAAAAEQDLENEGYSLATASAAVSKVLGGLTVTADQQSIFLQAVGIEGQPPQGYPKPIKVIDTPGQPGSGSGGSKPSTPTGESAHVVNSSTVDVAWHAVSGATSYRVRAWTATANVAIVWDQKSTQTQQRITGLHGKTNYGWHVSAINSAGGSAWSPNQHFKTS